MANRDTLEDLRIEKVRTAQAPPESSLFAFPFLPYANFDFILLVVAPQLNLRTLTNLRSLTL